jgi:hypothetical protein
MVSPWRARARLGQIHAKRGDWWAGAESNCHSRRRGFYRPLGSPPARPTHDGGDEGTRTPDLRDANAALFQLSYIPTGSTPDTSGGPAGKCSTRPSSALRPILARRSIPPGGPYGLAAWILDTAPRRRSLPCGRPAPRGGVRQALLPDSQSRTARHARNRYRAQPATGWQESGPIRPPTCSGKGEQRPAPDKQSSSDWMTERAVRPKRRGGGRAPRQGADVQPWSTSSARTCAQRSAAAASAGSADRCTRSAPARPAR